MTTIKTTKTSSGARRVPTFVLLLMSTALFATAADSRAADAKPAATTAPATTAPAERTITWKKTDITLTAESGGRVNVLTLKDPQINQANYAIRGTVSYTDVKGTGFLEMWSHFPDGSFFFSRTLDVSGPMGSLKGSSEPREFVLPFFAKPGNFPSRLEVNVVLPEGGTVKIGEAKLVQPFTSGSASATGARGSGGGSGASHAWWDGRRGGMIGGILGGSFGIIGATIGTLAGMGRARRLVLSLAVTSVIISAAMGLLAVFALATGQPYAVWYPLALTGVIGTGVIGALIPSLKRRYAEHELRRMTALDAVA